MKKETEKENQEKTEEETSLTPQEQVENPRMLEKS